jgi:hypothetical protein
MTTLTRIHESCKTQSLLESTNVFTPTRHILQAIRRIWMVDRVHDLPAVTDPSFFPSSSRNEDIWWDSQDMKTVYFWDSMDDQDRHGHHFYDKRDTTSFLIYTKTSNQITGVLRSRDGGGEVTSDPQSLRNRSNVG